MPPMLSRRRFLAGSAAALAVVASSRAGGAPPLPKMTRLYFEMNAYDIDTRIADEGRPPLVPLVHAHELTQAGVVMQDERVKVTTALVDHPPVVPALAFRFDCPDRSIVFSSDTNKSDNLVRLAKGADLLVHEQMWIDAARPYFKGDIVVARDGMEL